MRLDKFISHSLGLSRNDARQLITNKKIKVNDKIVQKRDFFIDCYKDVIKHNDVEINYQEFVYIMLNKPSGVISATTDKKYKTVIDLVRNDYPNYDLFPVGRLDIDTEGLLIITNNGKLGHNLTTPNKDIYKKYYVEVDGIFEKKDIDVFKNGLEIYDGNKNLFKTKPAILEIIDSNKAYISISEGKYHQVKKMCLKLNKEVIYLKRIEFKGIKLDSTLKLGQYRMLNDEEMQILLKDEML